MILCVVGFLECTRDNVVGNLAGFYPSTGPPPPPPAAAAAAAAAAVAATPMTLFLAHSGQTMSSPSVMKPLPAIDTRQELQRKHCKEEKVVFAYTAVARIFPFFRFLREKCQKKLHFSPYFHYIIDHLSQKDELTSECQWRPSKEMNLVPPVPVMGLEQAVQRLAKRSPKQAAQ